MSFLPCSGKMGKIFLVVFLLTLAWAVSAAEPGSLTVVVKDARTKAVVGSALVYLDGAYKGTTADMSGAITLNGLKDGTHTVRVTKPDFREVTTKIVSPDQTTVTLEIAKGALVLLNDEGEKKGAINVVFYPSSTSYSCTDHAKVSAPVYINNETRFREDVMKVIKSTYLDLDKVTSSTKPLPADYRDRFNFYYYYDTSAPADAFEGCAGTIPANYWNEVTFADITVILYPKYYGAYSDAACQPTGCSQDYGPGRNLMKAPSDQLTLIQHETGHAMYDLVDTYCGNTYYYQNDPHANVWSSRENCESDARSHGRDPAQCRQIQQAATVSSASCSQPYWRWDPMPDIMASGYRGKFGEAATQRINYVLSKAVTS
ncbi:MAG: hypothetical protein CW742_04690 [Methanoregula sp.]|nr:MAG: hypothetical protein CW742_04690 [Methanoregula sp.]